MVQHRTFMEFVLDDAGLHTPDGVLSLRSITRADIRRNRSRDYGEGATETSGAGVVGGALLGGALLGPVGALAGGLLGSSVKRKSDDVIVPRTVSATVTFESSELAYSSLIPRDRIEEGEEFVAAVKGAAGL
jgi:hypothetical protein